MSDFIVSCTDLRKTYQEGGLKVDVLKGINLSLTPGENMAIIGASGSGKSTLLHLLGGLDRPTTGEVFVAGKPMSTLPESDQGVLRNQTLGFVYQFHHLLSEFTALENVAMPLLIRGLPNTDAMLQAEKILESMGLKDRVEHKPGEMSGGERQRTAIARALVTRPGCILADEPTGNLDEQTAEQVFKVMLDLNKEHSVGLIMVTHNMDLIQYFDSIKIIHDGKLEDYTG